MTIEMRSREEFGVREAQQVDRAQELRSDINWAKKKTLSVDKVQSGKLIGFLKKKAVVLAGKTSDYKEDVAVTLPQISTNDPERAEEVRTASVAIQKEATHKAAKQGLISLEAAEEKLQRIDDGVEPRPEITFQKTSGLTKRIGRMARLTREKSEERQKKKTASFGPAAVTPKVWQAPTEKRRKVRKRDIVMVGSIPFLVAACGKVDMTPSQPTATVEVKPVGTEMVRPTASPEAINSFNESAQKVVDETFRDLEVRNVEMVGAGTLTDPKGREYALFTSTLPDKNKGIELDFLLIGEVRANNQIENLKGLVIDETNTQGTTLEFLAVSFNPEAQTFTVEGSLVRTDTQTGEIEIFNNGKWQSLEGPGRTINDVKQKLGGGVLVALTLPTPTPEVGGPSAQELRQILVGQGLEVEVKEFENGTEIVVKETVRSASREV